MADKDSSPTEKQLLHAARHIMRWAIPILYGSRKKEMQDWVEQYKEWRKRQPADNDK